MPELSHTDQVQVQAMKRTISFWATTVALAAALLFTVLVAPAIIIIALLVTAVIESSRWESANRQLAELHKDGQQTAKPDSRPEAR